MLSIGKLFKKEQPDQGPKLNPAVRRLNANNLPPDLKKFALMKLSERKFGPGGTVVHSPNIPNPTVKDLNKAHLYGCDRIEESDWVVLESDVNVNLVNEKLLFLVYDPEDYRLYGSYWFSFKDKTIYNYITDDGAMGFFMYETKKTLKPVPYKQWMKKKSFNRWRKR